jgi:hypothetical protein
MIFHCYSSFYKYLQIGVGSAAGSNAATPEALQQVQVYCQSVPSKLPYSNIP